MLGDYLVTIIFVLAVIGMVCIFLRNTIPGVIQGFLVVLKALFYVIAIPLAVLTHMINIVFSRKSKVGELVTRTITVSRQSTDKKGNVYTRTESLKTHERVNGGIFRSGRFRR